MNKDICSPDLLVGVYSICNFPKLFGIRRTYRHKTPNIIWSYCGCSNNPVFFFLSIFLSQFCWRESLLMWHVDKAAFVKALPTPWESRHVPWQGYRCPAISQSQFLHLWETFSGTSMRNLLTVTDDFYILEPQRNKKLGNIFFFYMSSV